MRGLVGAFAACSFFVLSAHALHGAEKSQSPAPDSARVPVLVELFTSEGCSDCPPADRLLEELDTKQPIPGVQAIVLSEHVTYWNHLGWRDPFSLDEVDQRQNEYGERFHLDSVYTPQAVIDGKTQLVGNNGGGLAQAVEHAGSAPKKPLTISDARWENGGVSFTVHGPADAGSQVIAVLASDATGPKVARGENAGRTLHHVAVVRTLKTFNASAADGRALRLSGGTLARDPSAAPARLIVFVVDKKTGYITAVNEQMLPK